ncbi:type II toxin-antitoxin system VapB family antitoxin [Parvibaculum sp.]|jgi:antitoxin VapB|uniref:type II toxin-antitoxin system VapB family antitoxin n=1 Tax=Parvibaculum sp. TaxID=2024848 RepID=UPI0039199B71
MAFSVKDEATDAAVRKLAKLKKTGLTDAIRMAVENEIKRSAEEMPLVQRLKAIGDRYSKYKKTGTKADKAFFDDLGGGL